VQRRALEARVVAVTSTVPLQAALTSHVDGPTLIDLFETEDWWQPVRDEFKIVRVISGDRVLASQGEIDVGTTDRDLVATARKDRFASAALAVAAKGRPNVSSVIAGAALVPVADDGAPVLLLGNAFDAAAVQALSDRAGQAVMLPQPSGTIVAAATADHRLAVQALVGREAEGSIVDPQGHWVAVLVALGPGVSVWTLGAASIAAPPVPRRHFIPLMAAPVVLAVGLLLLLSRRRAGAGEGAISEPVVKETTLRFGTSPQPHPKVESKVLQVSSPPSRQTIEVSGATGTATTPQRKQPKLFGRYKLLDQLGQGGMADIYTAVASGVEGFTRTFVLKRLRPELVHDKEAVSQFIDEARMQAGLVHSNIVPVFDFGVVNGEYFMTQEYIVGRDMVRVVHRYHEYTHRSLEPRYAYYVAHETLMALEYAHTKHDRDGTPMGIVHRDVSAANIMISLEGEVKLFDFGIVKARGRSTQTQLGMVKGNTSFMSPEQARGQEVDARSDVFSLGLVMYYCLTGQLLYEGDNDLDVLYKAATGPTAQDWVGINQLPAPTPALLARALAVDPAQRYQNAAAFAQDLAPHINGVKAEAASLMQVLFGDELRREAA
jgi:hypothetical protein